MTWWGQSLKKDGGFQPKQKNRFVVEMGTGGQLLSISSVTKPTVIIEKKEYRMINHFYNYPGIPKWEPVTMKFVDAKLWGLNKINIGGKAQEGNRETSKVLWEMLLSSGYVNPRNQASSFTKLPKNDNNRLAPVVSPEKAAMIDRSFGSSATKTDGSLLKIKQLKPDGTASEIWTLYNPIITKISWGELDYGEDGLVEYTLDVSYDWAELIEGADIGVATVGPQ